MLEPSSDDAQLSLNRTSKKPRTATAPAGSGRGGSKAKPPGLVFFSNPDLNDRVYNDQKQKLKKLEDKSGVPRKKAKGQERSRPGIFQGGASAKRPKARQANEKGKAREASSSSSPSSPSSPSSSEEQVEVIDGRIVKKKRNRQAKTARRAAGRGRGGRQVIAPSSSLEEDDSIQEERGTGPSSNDKVSAADTGGGRKKMTPLDSDEEEIDELDSSSQSSSSPAPIPKSSSRRSISHVKSKALEKHKGDRHHGTSTALPCFSSLLPSFSKSDCFKSARTIKPNPLDLVPVRPAQSQRPVSPESIPSSPASSASSLDIPTVPGGLESLNQASARTRTEYLARLERALKSDERLYDKRREARERIERDAVETTTTTKKKKEKEKQEKGKKRQLEDVVEDPEREEDEILENDDSGEKEGGKPGGRSRWSGGGGGRVKLEYEVRPFNDGASASAIVREGAAEKGPIAGPSHGSSSMPGASSVTWHCRLCTFEICEVCEGGKKPWRS